jgi:hypothetical protein
MRGGHCIAPSSSFAEWETHLEGTTDDAVHYGYVYKKQVIEIPN